MHLHVIDLNLPPAKRWCGVPKTPIKKLVRDAERALLDLYSPFELRLVRLAASLLGGTYRRSPFLQEISGLAAHAGVDPAQLLLLNLAYDLGSCSIRIPGMYGCTGALLRDVHTKQVCIVRTMDWAFPESIRDYTTMYKYRYEDVEVITAGFPGFIGVVSGVNSAGVALTLNQAFTDNWPATAYPVPWLVRDVLLHNLTFAAALQDLTTTRAASGGFYLLTDGVSGALVESTGEQDTVHILERSATCLTVANHFLHEYPDPDTPREWGDSFARQAKITERAMKYAPRHVLKSSVITHGATAHQLHIEPARGTMTVRCPWDAAPTWQTFYAKTT